MAEATLLVIRGPDQGARFTLGADPLGIGRGVGNEFRVIDTEASRQHAVIEWNDDGHVLRDRNSSNGTFVNGEQVQSVRLSSGDRIQIGRSVILFAAHGSPEGSLNVAERIDLVGHADPSDRSSIVGAVGHESGQSILDATSGTLVGGRAEAHPQEMAETLSNLRALYQIAEEAVSQGHSLNQMLQRTLDLTIEAVGADRGGILLRKPEPEGLVPEVFSIRHGHDERLKMPVSRSIVDYVLANRQGVRTTDARTDGRFETGQSILQAGIREAMCVPMQGRYEMMGVIYVDTTTHPEEVTQSGKARPAFTEEQLRMLVAVGRQSALAVENSHYQEALLKAERLAAMGQTIAMLSHHIKNILQGVRGGSYLIDMGLKDHNEDFIRKGWGIVEKNQNKIYHLVMDMLTFSKERQPVLERASLNETVADVCELMQARAEECEVAFEVELAEEIPVTTFDAESIHRAVLNIVINAIDAVEGIEGGAVRVQTGYDTAHDTVLVAVSDNGPGIPEDQVRKIFNIFESTKGASGTGLGLAVSQKILREHGGDITVHSRPDEGSQFVLAWPRIDEEHRGLDSNTSS